MKLVGLLGGVASGKSVVTKRLAELGAEVLDGDVTAHEVLREGDIRAAIRQRFGEAVFDEDGQVNRSALARVVFAGGNNGSTALTDLEKIMHPRIGQRLQEKMAEIDRIGKAQAVVLDAAVMMKAGWHKLCDLLVFVDVTPEIRVARSRSRGWSDEEVAAREARQTPLEVKRAAADVVIDNSGDLTDTFAQVDRFWQERIASKPAN